MIRDPSDGTVREEHQPKPLERQVHVDDKTVLNTTSSGLATDRLKADEIERLKASREWVKNWHQRKSESSRSPTMGEG